MKILLSFVLLLVFPFCCFSEATLDAVLPGAAVNVKSFGVAGDGVTDDTAKFQAAVFAAENGVCFVPAGVYILTAPIVIRGRTTLEGVGRRSSVLNFVNSGDGLQSTWPINGSNYADITVQGLYVLNTNPSNTGGGFVDVGGSYVHVIGNRFEGWKYGIVFDQTEISNIEGNEFFSLGTAGIWLVNGDQHSYGAKGLYTNVITIAKNTINTGSIGIADDGGYTHNIEDNCINAGTVAMRFHQPGGAKITGNYMEMSKGSSIVFSSTRLDGSTSHPGTIASIDNNFIYPSDGQYAIDIQAASVQQLNANGNQILTGCHINGSVAPVAGIHGADNLRSDIADGLHATGNLQLGCGYPSALLNNYLDSQNFVQSMAWTGSTSNPAIGNGTINADWSRKGLQVTLNYRIVMGSTTKFGSGIYSFALPFAAAAGGQNFYGVGMATRASDGSRTVLTPYIAQGGSAVQVYYHGGYVGPSSPISLSPNDVIEFTISYSKRGLLE